jgi:COP9 signalosome complex subunit 7
MDVDSGLEQFVLLAKSTRGDAAKHLIEQAIMSPGVYVFAELLNCRNIAELAQSTETRPHFDLLQLFAYGTYEQFIDERHKLPPLNDAMQLKLRQLTIASLAANCRRIGYATLLARLHLNGNVRQLEDLIIDAIYKGIIDGKLDPRNQLLEIESWRSRDVAVGDTQAMTDVLANWSIK